MSIISRIKRLFTAEAHNAIDNVEDPSVMANQIIREMDEKIDAGNDALINVEARLLLVRADQAKALEQVNRWKTGAVKANSSGDIELAKQAAIRSQDTQAQHDGFKKEADSLEERVVKLRQQIEDAVRARGTAVSNVSVMQTQAHVARAAQSAAEAVAGANMDDQMSELGRMQRKIQEQAAQAEASIAANERRSGTDIDRQLDNLNRQNADGALAAILAESKST